MYRYFFILFIFIPSVSFAEEEKESIACTMEAKLCPNGSYVARSGPDCAFAPCPGEEDTEVGPKESDPDED